VRPPVARLLPLFIFAASQTLDAQQWTLETGGGAASFEDESATGSGYLWGSWQGGLGPLYGRAGLGGTGFESGASGQAAADLSWLAAPLGGGSPWRLEIRTGGSGVRGTDDYLAGEVQGEFRVHGIWQRGGLWGGAIAGRGWTDQNREGRAVSGPALGGWVRSRMATAALTLTGTRLEGEWYPEMGFQLSWSTGPIDASGVVGARGEFGAEPAIGWASAAANWWFTDHWAVVLQGGGFPGDPVQGLPRGRRCPWLRLSAGVSPCASCPSSVRFMVAATIRFEVGMHRWSSTGTGPGGTGADGARRGHGVDAAG
jgi:hypothetical protein